MTTSRRVHLIARSATFVLGLLVTIASLVSIARFTDWSVTWQLVRNVGLGAWVSAAAIYLVGFLPRAWRWRLMLSDHGDYSTRDTLRGIVLGYTANNLLPFRLGEVVRALVFSRLTHLSRLTSLGSIVAERVCDGVAIVFILVVMLLWFGRTDADIALRPVFIVAAVMLAAGLVGGGLAMTHPDVVRRLVSSVAGDRVAALAARFLDAVRFMRSPRRLGLIVVLSLTIWAVEGAMFGLLAFALGIDTPVALGYFTLAIVNLGILVPSAPGYIGVFQLCSVLACSALGRTEEQGLALGMVVHGAQFVPLTLWGLWEATRLWGSKASFWHDLDPRSPFEA
jgi:uncharacterized protein (TIRG00374 family)